MFSYLLIGIARALALLISLLLSLITYMVGRVAVIRLVLL